ncbi:MAG TPA: ATP F0F1 synthase subunit B' [Rhodobacteraceae bacterium]|nr:F0F1 ATP synthase subunit B' [Amylibacter sp.]HAD28711.1 ATP F0F1 synthase subunit B' [Paracoccaceae bacterium]|tara:strand:+ start:3297 stop:3815 length:519 start_codon:yes stop_codon:yes gene_type:complete
MATETTEHAQGMPQLDFSTFPNQIFWLVVTLIVIYLLMSRVALPRIASVLTERHGAIQSDLDKADEMKAKAVEAEIAYNQALVDARAEAQSIVAHARAEIQKDLDVAMLKADAEIAVKTEESAAAIKEISATAVAAIKVVANDTAKEIVKTVMPGAGDAKAVKAAVTARLKG